MAVFGKARAISSCALSIPRETTNFLSRAQKLHFHSLAKFPQIRQAGSAFLLVRCSRPPQAQRATFLQCAQRIPFAYPLRGNKNRTGPCEMLERMSEKIRPGKREESTGVKALTEIFAFELK